MYYSINFLLQNTDKKKDRSKNKQRKYQKLNTILKEQARQGNGFSSSLGTEDKKLIKRHIKIIKNKKHRRKNIILSKTKVTYQTKNLKPTYLESERCVTSEKNDDTPFYSLPVRFKSDL